MTLMPLTTVSSENRRRRTAARRGRIDRYRRRYDRWMRRVHRLAVGTAVLLWLSLAGTLLVFLSLELRQWSTLLALFAASLVGPYIVSMIVESVLAGIVRALFKPYVPHAARLR